jgi:SAM-dependent methyltransferase
MSPESPSLASTDFWDAYVGNVVLPARPDPNMAFEATLANTLASVAPVTHGSTVIEVGCAPAKWLGFYAERFGARVTGIEYTALGAELSRRNLAELDIDGTIREVDFFAAEPDPHDLVLSLGFIEHFEDLDATFARHLDFLAPGGRIVIGVPNYRGVIGALQRWTDPAHLALHNVAAMDPALYRRLASHHGLAVTFQEHINGPDPIIVKVGRRAGMLGVGVLHRIRALPFGSRLNHRWVSSYLLTVMRRP